MISTIQALMSGAIDLHIHASFENPPRRQNMVEVARDAAAALAAQAEATGFRPDMLEKVALLLQLLDAVRSHPFLKDKLVLK